MKIIIELSKIERQQILNLGILKVIEAEKEDTTIIIREEKDGEGKVKFR